MRILQVSPYFFPYIGGQERYVQSLSQALVDQGHSVEIFTSNYPKTFERDDQERIRIKRFQHLFRPLNNPITPTMLFHLCKHVNDFNIVHTHNEHTLASLFCAMTRSHTRVPLLVSCHGVLRFDNSTKDFIERAYSRTFSARIFKKADRVLTMSEHDSRYIHLLGVPREKIRVVPNGVDLRGYSKINKLPEDLLFKNKKLVLFVGPLIKRKGPQWVVQAINQIVKEHPETMFAFVGKGDSKCELEELSKELGVSKYTYFTGYVPEDRLYALYARSDIFVLPSISEGQPYSILDAMAFSKPVVSSLIPCIKENFGGTAILVPTRNVDALAQKLVNLLGDEAYSEALGRRGRRLVETHFNFEIIVRKISDIYEELLRK